MVELRPNPYAPPRASEPTPTSEAPASGGPRGIGGWLIVCLISLVVWAIVYVIGLYGILVHIDLVSAGLAKGNLLVLARVILVPSGLVMVIVALAWMFRHDRRFPKLFVAHVVMQVIWSGAAALEPRSGVSVEVVLVLIVRALVWVNYFWVSERVEATFVR